MALEIHRQPLHVAADWQEAIIQEWRQHPYPDEVLPDFLERSGLLTRCVFLSSDTGDGPLLFRYIGEPSIRILGRSWATENLGRPHIDNPHRALPDCLGNEYAEALETGQPLHNLGIAHGLRPEPVRFTHTLIPWRGLDGRRAILSCVQL